MLKKITLKKITGLVFPVLMLLSSCSQKFDDIGPGIVDPSEQPSLVTANFGVILKNDFVTSPKRVVVEKLLYASNSISNRGDDINSWFALDFNIPSLDSTSLDSARILLALYDFKDTLNLPKFEVFSIQNNWNAITDSLLAKPQIDTTFFKNIQAKKNNTALFNDIGHVLQLTLSKPQLMSWYYSQIKPDSTLKKFRGLGFSTQNNGFYKFFSPTYPSSLLFSVNSLPKLQLFYTKKEINKKDSTFQRLQSFKKGVSVVTRTPIVSTDKLITKIGGVGGEGSLIKFDLSKFPKNALIINSKLILKKSGKDPIYGSLSQLKAHLINTTDSIWQANPQSIVDKILYELPTSSSNKVPYIYTLNINPTDTASTVVLNGFDRMINKMIENNTGFYLKAGDLESRLGYNLFKDISLEVSYLLPKKE